MTSRIETDSLGSVTLPADALYGINTERARENFPLSDRRLADEPELLEALLLVKRAAAEANAALGVLDTRLAEALLAACDEVLAGGHRDSFMVDPLESSGGTSLNMNVNEVLANLALRRLGAPPGSYQLLHPNDHVNLGQSTNDVLPTAIVIAARRLALQAALGVEVLAERLDEKAMAFAALPHLGRTCLNDAQPMTLGQYFGGQAAQGHRLADELRRRSEGLRGLPLGGTAVGAGWGAAPGFRAAAVSALRRLTGLALTAAGDPFDALGSSDGLARLSAEARTTADALAKLGQDLQFLASGPAGGLAEIRLPALQAGSSMMPGKVNPVMPMLLVQSAAVIAGHDATVQRLAGLGQLAINAYEPALAVNLLAALRLLGRSARLVADRCIAGLEADPEANRAHLLDSSAMTVLIQPRLGYAATAALVKRAAAAGRSVTAQMLSEGLATAAEIDALLEGIARR